MILRQLELRNIKPSKEALKLLQQKPLASYTIPTIDAINMIASKNFPRVKPVGSYIYKIQMWPGDIDLSEEIIKVGKKDPWKEVEKEIKKIVKIIEDESLGKTNFYLGDVKAGVDKRFLPLQKAAGKIEDGKIIGYNYNKVIRELNLLKQKKILDSEDHSVLKTFVEKKPTLIDLHRLLERIHEFVVLRWSLGDILKGYKRKQNKKIMFRDALKQDEIVKIDLWYWLYDRFVEITNLFNFIIKKKEMKKQEKQLEDSYVPDMKKELRKYLFDPFHFNPFKGLKRMWALSFIFKDDETSKSLTKLMSSGYAILYQIVGDLKILEKMIKQLNAPPYEKMGQQVDKMNDKIAYIYEFKIPKITYNKLESLYNHLSGGNSVLILETLRDLIKHLKNILNKNTLLWMERNKILPLDSIYKK